MTLHDVSVTCRSLACEIVRVTLAQPTLFFLPKLTFQPTRHLLERVLLFCNHIGLHAPSHLTSTQNSRLSYCSYWMSRLYTRTAIVNDDESTRFVYKRTRHFDSTPKRALSQLFFHPPAQWNLKLKIYSDCEHKKYLKFLSRNCN